MSQVTDAINLMQMAWADQKQRPVDLGGQRIPDDLAAQWDAVTYQVQIAIANFNHIMVKYNQAITQFPARLVVGLFGFRAAGTM